jgi:uncharacterized protein YndB with AHSA1/START domain
MSVRREFTLRRRVAAEPAQVWEAWTTPAHLARFLFPPSVDVGDTAIELDLREGGRLVAAFRDGDGAPYRTTMTIETVQPPSVLALSWPRDATSRAGQITVTLSPVGRDTLVQYRFRSEADKQDLLAVRAVAVSSLERLDLVLWESRQAVQV